MEDGYLAISTLRRSESAMSMQEPILSVKDLTKVYEKETGFFRKQKQSIVAVDKVSFDIFESEFVSIVGETGSGKSTIAKCLAALEEPNSGNIIFEGKDVSNLRGSKLLNYWRQVQMIFQDPFESLIPRQTMFDAVAMPIRNLQGEKNNERLHEKVSRLLEEVDLDPSLVMNRFPHQLSGGQRQRASIARALASDPRILIADEPITMLDAAQRLNVLSLLSRLGKKRKLTVLMITHDLSSAKLTCNRIIVVYQGKIVEAAPASTVVSEPFHPYVELIMESQQNMASIISEKAILRGEIGERPLTGCVFEPRCKYATSNCKSDEPPLRELTTKHYVACHNPLDHKRSRA